MAYKDTEEKINIKNIKFYKYLGYFSNAASWLFLLAAFSLLKYFEFSVLLVIAWLLAALIPIISSNIVENKLKHLEKTVACIMEETVGKNLASTQRKMHQDAI